MEGEPEHAIRINPTRIWGHRSGSPAGSNPAAAASRAGKSGWPEIGAHPHLPDAVATALARHHANGGHPLLLTGVQRFLLAGSRVWRWP
jgi:hypothetical protein